MAPEAAKRPLDGVSARRASACQHAEQGCCAAPRRVRIMSLGNARHPRFPHEPLQAKLQCHSRSIAPKRRKRTGRTSSTACATADFGAACRCAASKAEEERGRGRRRRAARRRGEARTYGARAELGHQITHRGGGERSAHRRESNAHRARAQVSAPRGRRGEDCGRFCPALRFRRAGAWTALISTRRISGCATRARPCACGATGASASCASRAIRPPRTECRSEMNGRSPRRAAGSRPTALPCEEIRAAAGVDLRRHAAALAPVFETQFVRHSAQVVLGDGTRVEVCLDAGTISAGRFERSVAGAGTRAARRQSGIDACVGRAPGRAPAARARSAQQGRAGLWPGRIALRDAAQGATSRNCGAA